MIIQDENKKERIKRGRIIIPFLCRDIVFKSVFIDYPNILGKMISDITNIDYKLIEDNIELVVNEIPIKRKNEKFKRCDFIVEFSNNIINLELNTNRYKSGKVKNLAYIFDIYATNSSKGKDYNNNLDYIQINLNCFKESTKKALTKYMLISDDDRHISYIDNLKIKLRLILNILMKNYNKWLID